MTEPKALAETRRWLRFCHEDLAGARGSLGLDTGAPRHACWLAQQAAEKAIKAALVFLQIDFPKTHDLDALRNRLPGDWQTRDTCADLAGLSQWAVEARYPGNWPEASPSDASAAVEGADAVIQAITGDLESRGFRQ